MTMDKKFKRGKFHVDRAVAKNQHYHLVTLINMNILEVTKYYLHNKTRQAKLTYSSFRKTSNPISLERCKVTPTPFKAMDV